MFAVYATHAAPDDPLSALDVATEAKVEAELRSVLASTTALIVAHRPSTVLGGACGVMTRSIQAAAAREA